MSEMAVIRSMLQESDAKLADLEKTVEFERRFNQELRKKLMVAPNEKSSAIAHHGNAANGAVRSAGHSGKLPEKIAKILKGAETMRAIEITKALELQGETCKSEKGLLPNVLSTLRRRVDLFENVSRGVYRIKKKE